MRRNLVDISGFVGKVTKLFFYLDENLRSQVVENGETVYIPRLSDSVSKKMFLQAIIWIRFEKLRLWLGNEGIIIIIVLFHLLQELFKKTQAKP